LTLRVLTKNANFTPLSQSLVTAGKAKRHIPRARLLSLFCFYGAMSFS